MPLGKSNYIIEDVIPRSKPPVFTAAPSPIIMPVRTGGCACNAGSASASGFEQKIRENPMIFVLGALAVGYFLAKK